MPTLIASFACGLLFGFGLLISGMTQPAKVLGFLDVFGTWNPTLAFVMAGALLISSLGFGFGFGFAFARRRQRPLFAAQSLWPTRTDIDAPLVLGSVLFGVGWGLVGLCPGPALENIVTLSPRVFGFVAAMVLGMVSHNVWEGRHKAAACNPAPTVEGSMDG